VVLVFVQCELRTGNVKERECVCVVIFVGIICYLNCTADWA
jgi:hypothetical protein